MLLALIETTTLYIWLTVSLHCTVPVTSLCIQGSVQC